ncbi:peptidylprolyl isomerase [Thiolapillus sp.]
MRTIGKILFAFILPTLVWAADDNGKILIDGPETDLTLGELRQVLLTIPEETRKLVLTQPKKIRDIMDSTYMVKVAAKRAKEKGLDKDPVIQAKLWHYEQNLLANAEVRDVQQKLIGDDVDYEAAARELYLMEKDKFKTPATYEASHILLTADKGEDEKTLKSRIGQIRDEILSGKMDFAAAAKQYSMDEGTASKGGSLGTFNEGRMVQPFDDALKKMQPGDISEPVKTRFGWHLIALHKKTASSVKPFDEVKKELIARVRQKAENEINTDYWLKVKTDPRAKVDESLFESFVAKPALQDKP